MRIRRICLPFPPGRCRAARANDLGFAGFRLHGRLNRADYFDEICAFLGASYFRAVAKGQAYGLSARGLALNTVQPQGEEFPVFRSFWLETPEAGADAVVVHALMDSPSVSGAFRFDIHPGELKPASTCRRVCIRAWNWPMPASPR